MRTPAVQVPIATLSGYGNRPTAGAPTLPGIVNNACSLSGTTKPFSATLLEKL